MLLIYPWGISFLSGKYAYRKRMFKKNNLTIDTNTSKTLYKSDDLIVYEMNKPVEQDGNISPYLGMSPTTGKMYIYPIQSPKDLSVVKSILSVCPEIVNNKEISC